MPSANRAALDSARSGTTISSAATTRGVPRPRLTIQPNVQSASMRDASRESRYEKANPRPNSHTKASTAGQRTAAASSPRDTGERVRAWIIPENRPATAITPLDRNVTGRPLPTNLKGFLMAAYEFAILAGAPLLKAETRMRPSVLEAMVAVALK